MTSVVFKKSFVTFKLDFQLYHYKEEIVNMPCLIRLTNKVCSLGRRKILSKTEFCKKFLCTPDVYPCL